MTNKITAESPVKSNYTSIGDFLDKYFKQLRKHGWCIIVLACIFAVLNIGRVYLTYTPLYTAEAIFTISTDVTASNTSYYNNTTTSQLSKTFPYIITSSTMQNVIAKDLGISSVPGSINVSALDDTNLFTMTVTASDYKTAYNILKSVLNNYPQVANHIIGNTQLTLITSPPTSAPPTNTPSYRNVALIGAAAGAALGILIILALTMINKTINKPEEITSVLNCHKLGVILKVIPKKNSKKKSSVITITNNHIDKRFIESVSSIRNNLIKKHKTENVNSIIFTSTVSNEGKSTISANVALSLAKKNYKTIIVDADLRNPSIKEQLGIADKTACITDVLKNKIKLSDAIVKLPKSNLYALLGSEASPKASEFVSSPEMLKMIHSLQKAFDFVIIDMPPAGLVSDAVSLKNDADGLVYVVRQDYAKIPKIIDSIDSFGGGKIKMLGCILNYASGAFGNRTYGRYGYGKYGGYGYGYGYGYGSYGYGYSSNKKKKDKVYDDNESYKGKHHVDNNDNTSSYNSENEV